MEGLYVNELMGTVEGNDTSGAAGVGIAEGVGTADMGSSKGVSVVCIGSGVLFGLDTGGRVACLI